MTDATLGTRIMDLADRLAHFSETPAGLSCTYLSDAHRAAAGQLADWMREAGLETSIDAVGNVVGRYESAHARARTLIVGSHYDTVIDAGKYDGRLGILTGLVALDEMIRSGQPPSCHVELIAFSEEEGIRFGSPYIGSRAVAGRFDPAMLAQRDTAGVTLADAIASAGHDADDIPRLARRAPDLAGYIEVHIEQGPVLLNEDCPVGIVTSIAGAVRSLFAVTGEAGHAGTVPMPLRHDAAAAAAEMVLLVEGRCAGVPSLVGTVGQMSVPGGVLNTIPGRCDFSLDLRGADDATLLSALDDIVEGMDAIARRRGVAIARREISRTAAVACSPRMRALLSDAVARAGIPERSLTSGAGHDAVNFAGLTEVGMLFVRCGNCGISHSPKETVTAGDAAIAAAILRDLLAHIGTNS